MSVTVEFPDTKSIHRILHLIHRDRARVIGNIVLAEEKLDAEEAAGKGILPGNVRKQARQTVATGPEQERVLIEAQDALRAALARVREEEKR